uniref:RING-type E3 ubiquitin transferase n=1 Tax=Plectus sambesii TaxID=2011161 RepID=A0A914VE76_9BILA
MSERSGRRRRRAYIDDSLIELDNSPPPRSPPSNDEEPEDADDAQNAASDNEVDNELDVTDQPILKRSKVEEVAGCSKEGAVAETETCDDEGKICLICFEEYSNAGAHRLVCLACGHLFGKSCIERWLRSEKVSKCPNCKAKAKLKDIRQIYGRAVQMRDTTELEQVKEINAMLRSENDSLKLQLARDRLKAQKEKETLEKELTAARSATTVSAPSVAPSLTQTRSDPPPQPVKQPLSLAFRSSAEVSRADSCRAISFCPHLCSLVVTSQNQQPMFHPFGFKKVDIATGKPLRYFPVHEGRPRDCVFSPSSDGQVLSTGEDKSLRITCTVSNTVIKRFALPANGWSCCWQGGVGQPYVYAGLSNGQVLMFDTRMGDADASEPIKDVTGGVNRVPVSTVHWIDQTNLNGLLVTDLKQCTFYDASQAAAVSPHVLIADEGQITSVCYDKETSQFAATFRPGSVHQTVTHKLYRLAAAEGAVQADVVKTWAMKSKMQTFMTRNALFNDSLEEGRLMGAAFDETSATVSLYDWTAARELTSCRLPSFDKDVMGVAHVYSRSSNFRSLAVLTQKKLHWLDMHLS